MDTEDQLEYTPKATDEKDKIKEATILKNKTEQVGELYDSVSADAQDKEDVKKPGQIMQQRKT